MTEQNPVRPGIAERLSRMVQLPTVSAELDVRGREPFEAFEALIRELYPLVHEHLTLEKITDFGLLYRWAGPATSRGAASSDEPVVLMAHYDVVPVDLGDPWTYPPFDGTIADGIVWGRGTLDDKGELCLVLEAVENLLQAGFRPARDVYLSFGGNEETFGDAAKSIAATLHERGIRPWLVLDEGGAVTDAPLPFIPLVTAVVGVAEKGAMTLRLDARGEPGHASAPPRETATTRLALAVRRINRRGFRPHFPRAAGTMFRVFRENTTGRPRAIVSALLAVPPLTARLFAGMGGDAGALVRTTVAVTMLDGGTAANVLPSQASATLNIRIAVGETVAGSVARIRRIVRGLDVSVTVLEGDDPSPESATDNAQFALIRDAVSVAYPEAVTAPYVQMSATDARHFHRFSPATYRFAPLLMTTRQRGSIHGIDEHVTIDSLERGERFYAALLRSLPA
ncbi:MAG: M20/M25/M40 family metallo-hydrolase [Leifsonia sp.]